MVINGADRGQVTEENFKLSRSIYLLLYRVSRHCIVDFLLLLSASGDTLSGLNGKVYPLIKHSILIHERFACPFIHTLHYLTEIFMKVKYESSVTNIRPARLDVVL